MTDLLARLEALDRAATPEPWHQKDAWNIECPDCGEEKYVCDLTAAHEDGTEYLSLMVQLCGLESLCAPNAALIVALRNVAPALLRVARAAHEVAHCVQIDSEYALVNKVTSMQLLAQLRAALAALDTPPEEP